MGIASSGNHEGRKSSRMAMSSSSARGTRSGNKQSGPSVKITIKSDFIAGRDVQKRILDDVAACNYDAQSAFAIKLALEEALINAIKHGNKLDPAKQVHVEANVTPQQTEIIIEDEGPGFDRACVPDPTQQENLERCSGRGILLMEAYMSRVEWSRGGRRVRMIKTNGDTGGPAMAV
jgi:serine/threonine-protein kinase RsbW